MPYAGEVKIALIHDYLNQRGGAERVLQVLCAMFPHAPIYTTVYDEAATGGVFRGREIRTSFLQKIPFASGYAPILMPLAVEQFDTSGFDVVLSVSHSFAKGVIVKPHTRHICYCLTPPRYLWDDSHRYVQQEFRYPALLKRLMPPFLSYLRVWDREASLRSDAMVAVSRFVQGRIKKYYHRDAPVIHPPVNTAKFAIAPDIGDYFLMVGRLVTYKKFDLAIAAFNRLGSDARGRSSWPLKIVGTGVDGDRLRRMAGPNVQFLGSVSDERLADLYAHAKALIFPQEEDFGIVPLEAMASGRPVIAYAGGGALETVVDGMTGMFFSQQTEASLIDALKRFESVRFDPKVCRLQAEKFDISVFQDRMRAVLERTI